VPVQAAAKPPYIKLATQLFGDRMMIANATGCLVHLRRQRTDWPVHL